MIIEALPIGKDASLNRMSKDQASNSPMRNSPEYIKYHTAAAREELPLLSAEANALVELTAKTKEAGGSVGPETIERAKELLGHVARWRATLDNWKTQDFSEEQSAELRTLRVMFEGISAQVEVAAARLQIDKANNPPAA